MSVSVNSIYFGLGSNLGNRLQNLREAVRMLESFGHVVKASNVYATAPWGGVPQPEYLNACVKIEIESEKRFDPHEILRRVKDFERELGRVESVRWGARKIDIDILIIDSVKIKSPELTVPHMRIPERMFVLVPLGEILPQEWTHPENGLTIREMISRLDDDIPLRITAL